MQDARASASAATGGEADDDGIDYYDTSKGFYCDTITADGLPTGPGVPTEVCLRAPGSQGLDPPGSSTRPVCTAATWLLLTDVTLSRIRRGSHTACLHARLVSLRIIERRLCGQ